VVIVVALIPDLLFGSKVSEQLGAVGHEVVLCSTEQDVWGQADRADVLVVDLTSDQVDGATLVDSMRAGGQLHGTKTVAFYAHVDTDAKARAEEVGFDLVVPRSRMAREGADLVGRLTA
jgi:CheY-like chemotaxis protein